MRHDAFPFLGKRLAPPEPELHNFFNELAQELTTSAIILHPDDYLLLLESLAFYESCDVPEILAPPTLVYASFV